MVKLEVSLLHGCSSSNQEVSWGDEANDAASPWNPEGGKVHHGASA